MHATLKRRAREIGRACSPETIDLQAQSDILSRPFLTGDTDETVILQQYSSRR